MGEARPKDQPRQARAVLERDPENIEARIMLAHHAPSPYEALALLRDAVNIGNQLWAPVWNGAIEVPWWEHPPTRPYMTAIFHLGMVTADIGQIGTARRCFRGLISMCPSDPLEAAKELEALAIYADDQAEPPPSWRH